MMGNLDGFRVMVVEDEALIAMHLEDILEDMGLNVVGRFRAAEPALSFIETAALDVAVLDVNLGSGTTSFPIAERLAERGIPFLFLTGYGDSRMGDRFPEAQVLSKPTDEDRLRAILSELSVDQRSS